MKKVIYLHIGKHKTGSTSIQKYLESNFDFFYNNDFEIIENNIGKIWRKRSKDIPYNCTNLAHIAIRNNLSTPIRIRGRDKNRNFFQKTIDAVNLNKKLRLIKKNKIIISTEAFSFIRTWQESMILKIMFMGFTVQPIIFIREKKSWLKSWEKQLDKLLIKFPNHKDSSDGIFDFSINSWLVNDDGIIKLYGQKTIVISYEKSLDKSGSVIPDFLYAIDLNPTICPAWDVFWFNKTKV